MAEVPDAGENHRHAMAVGSLYDFLVADRPPRLDDGSGPDPRNLFHAIGEWKEGV
jgi:hypothetical protein